MKTTHNPTIVSKPAPTQENSEIIDVASIPCSEISDADKLVKNPMVTVTMITYNHEPFIAEAIEGVINQQTEYPFELIIGEDCSADRTREIVLDYQRRYPETIRVLTADKNVGARRNGLRTKARVRGEYRAPCEGDDYWHRHDKLQKQVEFLEGNPCVALVHSAYRTVQTKTGQVRTRDHSDTITVTPHGEELFRAVLTDEYERTVGGLRTCTICLRTDIAGRILSAWPELFVTERIPMGDIPLFLELARITDFAYMDTELATYRRRGDSLSQRSNPASGIRFILAGCDCRLLFIEKYGASRKDRRRTFFPRCMAAAKLASESDDRDSARAAADMLERGLGMSCSILVWYLKLTARLPKGGSRLILSLHNAYRSALCFLRTRFRRIQT